MATLGPRYASTILWRTQPAPSVETKQQWSTTYHQDVSRQQQVGTPIDGRTYNPYAVHTMGGRSLLASREAFPLVGTNKPRDYPYDMETVLSDSGDIARAALGQQPTEPATCPRCLATAKSDDQCCTDPWHADEDVV